VSPREQPLKLLHGVQSHVNKYSLPRRVCNYVHRIVFQFYVCFLACLSLMCQLPFPYLATSSRCAILSHVGLFEVPATYLGSIGYFLARGPVLPNGCSLEKLMLNKGSRVCIILSLVLYPKHVYFASLALTAEYWGSGHRMSLNKAIT
jgi:hypothetical protein